MVSNTLNARAGYANTAVAAAAGVLDACSSAFPHWQKRTTVREKEIMQTARLRAFKCRRVRYVDPLPSRQDWPQAENKNKY